MDNIDKTKKNQNNNYNTTQYMFDTTFRKQTQLSYDFR
jgi:hypothetical protein